MKSNRFHFFEWQLKYENGAFKNDCFLIIHNFSLHSISRSFANLSYCTTPFLKFST